MPHNIVDVRVLILKLKSSAPVIVKVVYFNKNIILSDQDHTYVENIDFASMRSQITAQLCRAKCDI